jgi:3-deoxy-D-manno-octulosonate 8-phosphate phosphatase (KDO 8-P phosphatase)
MNRPGKIPVALRRRLQRVELFLCDVDGVLTDASVYIGQATEGKRFHIRDGLGLLLLKREGIRVGWISARQSAATTLRATELGIDFLHQEKGSKRAAIEQILARTGRKWEHVCYVGDDIVDLAALKHAGVAVAVADGSAEARALAHYVTRQPGGHGAVREVVELILKAQNRWERLVEQHLAL